MEKEKDAFELFIYRLRYRLGMQLMKTVNEDVAITVANQSLNLPLFDTLEQLSDRRFYAGIS